MLTTTDTMEIPEIDGIVRELVADYFMSTRLSRRDVTDMMEAFEEYINALHELNFGDEEEVRDCATAIVDIYSQNV